MHDTALSNYAAAVILKGLSVLEAGQWSMAISVCSHAHLSILHFPILYLSLCLKGVDGKQRQLRSDVMTT